jgi:hypothetical protein
MLTPEKKRGTTMPLRPEIRASLQRVSTATIATALFNRLRKFGFSNRV